MLVAGVALVGACATPNDDGIVEEKACVDIWSAVHVGSGYYLGERLGPDRGLETLGLLVGFELAEPQFWPGFGENRLNQQCDVVVGALGWLGWLLLDGD